MAAVFGSFCYKSWHHSTEPELALTLTTKEQRHKDQKKPCNIFARGFLALRGMPQAPAKSRFDCLDDSMAAALISPDDGQAHALHEQRMDEDA